jgi:hypothetical protein
MAHPNAHALRSDLAETASRLDSASFGSVPAAHAPAFRSMCLRYRNAERRVILRKRPFWSLRLPAARPATPWPSWCRRNSIGEAAVLLVLHSVDYRRPLGPDLGHGSGVNDLAS